MSHWLRNSILYEINTWPWLERWSAVAGKSLSLADVPAEAWDRLAATGAQGVWLMGVWERSPMNVSVARRNRRQLLEWRQSVPDLRAEDVIGSPYSVRRYEVDPHLGGRAGLQAARTALARRGIRLVLDFVPNHVAPDHPWVTTHPDWFIQGSRQDLRRGPDAFQDVGGRVFARGRDPYFPPWSDVLQLNVFNSSQRRAASRELQKIASLCDAVRCDMAMLVMNDVFQRTWGERAGAPPTEEYWPDVIGAVRSSHPEFRFIAEAYWGLETRLLTQGFDAVYDKGLYDGLAGGSAEVVRDHLAKASAPRDRCVRFLENHDERRAAQVFPGAKGLAATVVLLTIPGVHLLHDGQLEGLKTRMPVHLRRYPHEANDPAVEKHYSRLLGLAADRLFREGTWELCECSGWPDNESYRNLLAWSWRAAEQRCLIVVNYSDRAAQGRVRLAGTELAGKSWSLRDLVTDLEYQASGDEISHQGLFVDLPAWGSHILRFLPAAT